MKITTEQAQMPKFENMLPKMQLINGFFSRSLLHLGLAPCLLLGLFGCNNLNDYGMNAIGVNVTAIKELKPQKDDNSPVYVQGKVERKIPLIKQQIYQIDDSTGQVWVVTNQKSWKVGDKVVVKALPRYESIPMAGTELGELYLEEK